MSTQAYKSHCFLTVHVQSTNSSPERPGKVSLLIKSKRAPLALKVALLGRVRHSHAQGAGIKNTLKNQGLEHSRIEETTGRHSQEFGAYRSSEPQKFGVCQSHLSAK